MSFELCTWRLGYPAPWAPPGMSSPTLMGCKRVLGDTHRPKLPITIELLQAIFSQLDLTEPMACCILGSLPGCLLSFLRKSNVFVQGPGHLHKPSSKTIVIDLGKRAWKSAYFESSLFIIHEC